MYRYVMYWYYSINITRYQVSKYCTGTWYQVPYQYLTYHTWYLVNTVVVHYIHYIHTIFHNQIRELFNLVNIS